MEKLLKVKKPGAPCTVLATCGSVVGLAPGKGAEIWRLEPG
jgi:hypothetical protein